MDWTSFFIGLATGGFVAGSLILIAVTRALGRIVAVNDHPSMPDATNGQLRKIKTRTMWD